MERLPGRPGQDLVDEGHGSRVMHAAGALLRELQALPPEVVPGLAGEGPVLVHGDFGPQNMLFDAEYRVTGLLDWEFAHRGQAIDDLAWAEWILRMHHDADSRALEGLYAGYGRRPPWERRHAAMLARCEELRTRCAREGQQAAATMWAARTDATAGWDEGDGAPRPADRRP